MTLIHRPPMKTLRLFLFACALVFTGARTFAQTTVTITATDATAAETLPGQPANPGNMRITRTGSTAGALTVWVKVDGVAVQGVDYTFGGTIGGSVVIPAGSGTLDIPVAVIDDFLTEGTEDVRIKLESKTSSGANVPYTLGAADRGIVNIADNEDPLAPLRAIVTVAAVDAVATETPGGTDPAVFRITRTNNPAPALSILYSLGGSATAGVDYTVPPATITMPAGAAFVDVPIVPIDDPLIENAETVIFTLLPTDVAGVPPPAEAYALGLATTATATILSDDLPPRPVVTISSPGTNGASARGTPMTVTFSASASDGYIVSYFVSAGGGTSASGTTNLPASTPAGTPYSGTATVTFNGTGTGMAPLTVTATNDHGVSATSTVNVYVFTAPPQPPLPPVLPHINIYPLNAEGAEVAAGSPNAASFRVTHDFPATATVSFLFAMSGSAREGIDYTLSSGGAVGSSFLGRWFTFPAGTTEVVIDAIPIDDLLIESTETVTMSLYTPPFIGFNEGGPQGYDPGTFGFYYGPNYTATVGILDNDATPPPFPLITITASDPNGTETVDGTDPAVFTVTRTSGPTDVPLTVNYALTIPPKQTIYVTELRPAMATNGVDFPLLTGTVTIPAGATSADLVIVPAYDLIKEVSELLQITLRPSAAVWPADGGYVIDEQIVADVRIHDAVLPAGTPTVWIRVTDALAFREFLSGRTASFSIERNGDLTSNLAVAYTIGGTATTGVDYGALPAFVTIPAGSASVPIVINPYVGATGVPETVSITLNLPVLIGGVPPYLLGNTPTMQRSAGISIIDRPYISSFPLSPRQRIVYRRLHHAILALPPPPPPPPPALAAAAAPPTVWIVEASSDLANWEEVGTTDPSGEAGDFVDVNAGDYPQRFYRFRSAALSSP